MLPPETRCVPRAQLVFHIEPVDAASASIATPPTSSGRAAKIHSIKKDRKLYLWDYSLVPSLEARIENLVASHLLKFCHFLEDTEGYRIELHFLRDREKREVDFLVAVDRIPWFAVEVKKAKTARSSNLRYFAERLRIPFQYRVVWDLPESYTQGDVFVMSPNEFLTALC